MAPMAPHLIVRSVVATLFLFSVILFTPAQTKKPNTLVIKGYDPGICCIY